MILNEESIWKDFAQRHKLSLKQIAQFKKYVSLLEEANQITNLTTITNLQDIIYYHFDDSITLLKFYKLTKLPAIADVGTGAGFPGIPLKILCPDLKIYLIEVNQKKVEFLEHVVEQLELTDVEYITIDWRNFLRSTHYPIGLFCSRASLQPEELIRAFNVSGPYKEAVICYWASKNWQPEARISHYIVHDYAYKVGEKERRLIIFKNNIQL